MTTANGSGDSGSTGATVTGLTNGCDYTVMTSATNKKGSDAAQTSGPSTPIRAAAPPNAVTGLTATATGTTTASVTWNAAAANGTPATGYAVTDTPTTGSSPQQTTCTTASCTATLSDLAPGTAYTFSVVGHSAAGDSPTATSNSITTQSPPPPPPSPTPTPRPSSTPTTPPSSTLVGPAIAAGAKTFDNVGFPPNGYDYRGEKNNDGTYNLWNDTYPNPPHAWCEFFLSYVWHKFGNINVPDEGGSTLGFARWAQSDGRWGGTKADIASARVGDALVYNDSPGPVADPNAYTGMHFQHTGIVTAVNSDGTVVETDGDFNGNGDLAASHVLRSPAFTPDSTQSDQKHSSSPGLYVIGVVRADKSAPTTPPPSTPPSTPPTSSPSSGPDVTSYPGAASSRYISDATKPDTTVLASYGCTQGKDERNNNNPSGRGLVVLDFGAQTKSAAGTFGTVANFSNNTFTDAEIHDRVKAYADSLASSACGGHDFVVAIGTNNSVGFAGDTDPAGAGVAWAQLVSSTNADLAAATKTAHVSVAGADDLEDDNPGPMQQFGSSAPARTWAQSFADNSSGLPYYDYGAASGCTRPTAGSTDPTCAGDWRDSDIFAVSAGTYDSAGRQISIPYPEIYVSGQSSTWLAVAYWGYYNGGHKHMNFAGAFSEHANAPAQKTPQESWQTLYTDLTDSSSTYYDANTRQASLPYATDDIKDN